MDINTWDRAANCMEIKANEVHLWFADDEDIRDNDLLARYLALLNDEERAQQQRFHFERHRHQYLITRALVRSVLSLYTDAVPPEAWKFNKNTYNKPYIAHPQPPAALSFNLSHTEKMVALAVTQNGDIGVDVEYLPRENVGLDIAKRYFSETEFQELCALPADLQKRRFLDLWTLKEAYIKARGMGLAIPLDQFSYSFPRPGEIQISFSQNLHDNAGSWRLWQFKPGDTHIAALALHASDTVTPHVITTWKTVPLEHIEQCNLPAISRSRIANQRTTAFKEAHEIISGADFREPI